jgi:pSer/pThr/pTyr-binding forkhead associated (FHA) protein
MFFSKLAGNREEIFLDDVGFNCYSGVITLQIYYPPGGAVQSPTLTMQPARLVALQKETKPAEYLLESKICLIGRSEMCQIVTPDKAVSRIQAVIKQGKVGHYTLLDSNSANGTFVNGQRIHAPYVLKDQDEIGLGRVTALLRFEAAAKIVSINEAEATIY